MSAGSLIADARCRRELVALLSIQF
jgi:hypothetical protein